MDYDIVSQISTSKKNCRIKVRVVRTWDSIIPPFQNLISTDFLLLDEQENSIQAFARKQEASDFKDLLIEGNVYYLANFNILPNKKSYRAANGKYIIQLTRSTTVNETKDHVDAIPLHKFTFTDFLDISDDNENNVNLIEVIGQIISVGSLTHLYAGPKLTPKRNVEIQNLRKDKLSVTLWDKFATDFDEDAIMNKEKDIPVIIIFVGMTVKTFKEKVYLCTSSASRFYVNLQIPAVEQFHLRLQSQTYQIQLVEEKNQPILTLEEEMATSTKSLAELLKLDWQHFQDTKFFCKAQLKSIDTTYGWWYRACYRCKCAVRNYGETFCCSKCGRNDKPPIPWYKLNAIVEDETATANFTIFGKLAQDLIQIPASQLATSTNADRYTLPPVISTILGSTHIFQIILSTPTFSTESMSFKVVRILSPPERETTTTSEQFASSSSYTINHTQQAKRNREDQLELYLEHSPSKQEMSIPDVTSPYANSPKSPDDTVPTPLAKKIFK